MKITTTFFLILFSMLFSAQNYEISTLRIGDYTVFMKKEMAEKIAKKKLKRYDEFDQYNKVNYFGQQIEISITEYYVDEKSGLQEVIGFLSTKSQKFRTKSGIGVGSTKEEVFSAYKNYPNFSVHASYEDDKKPQSGSIFTLEDADAGTNLSFKMIDNIVVEIRIYFTEGC